MAAVPKLRIALIQLAVTANKAENLNKAHKLIKTAAQEGAKLVSLPECFNCPYGNQYFKKYAEPVPGESYTLLSNLAKENEIYIIGGSIPEVEKDKYYNSCLIFSPSGELIDKHRKLHLFDIDIPNKITMKESDTLTPGNKLTEFQTPYGKVGIGICYDMRFAELGNLYAQRGCKLLVYPGAFNMTTGPAHWKILQQARAVDNQVYVASVSPARDEKASYVAWGHSMITNPWGDILGELDHTEGILYADLDFNYLEEVRQQIPITKQKRLDIYEVKCKI